MSTNGWTRRRAGFYVHEDGARIERTFSWWVLVTGLVRLRYETLREAMAQHERAPK